MRRSVIKLSFIEIITLIVLIINTFVIRIFSSLYFLSAFLGFILIVTILLVGFERERFLNKKRNLLIILTFTISLLVIKFGFGLVTGFLYSPYNRSIRGLFENIFPVLIFIIVSEVLRYTFVVKGGKNKFLFVLTTFIFTFAYLNITTNLLNLTSLKTIVEMITTDIATVLFENIALTFLSKNYGYSGALTYSLIMNIYIYLVPIVPDLGDYLEAITMVAFPILILLFSNYLLQTMKKEDYDPRSKHTLAKLVRLVMILIMAMIVGLNSNLFRYWIAVIASGSMEPTIEVGDVIIVDKSYQNRIDELQVGDVLVFTMNDKIYTHRIIEVTKKNDKYYFKTQGDRKGQAVDTWTVTKDEVVGVTRHTIKYIGLPSIWLKNAIERN